MCLVSTSGSLLKGCINITGDNSVEIQLAHAVLRIKITEDETLEVNKLGQGTEGDTINIQPSSSNVVHLS